MNKKLSARAIVFDFNRTLYNPDSDALMQGALEVLEKAHKHFPLALYCKSGEGRSERVSELGLDKFFKKIIFVENKTPQDFIDLAKEFGLKTKDFVVVGDRIKSEIAAAKGAGCKAIWFRNGKFAGETPSGSAEEPDCVISKLEELLEKIEIKQ